MHMANRPPYPGIPRWVKVFGIIVIALVLLVIAMMFTGGEHGPGRHTESGDAGGQVPASFVMEEYALPEDGRG
jgi:hypothetical protein